MRTNERNGFENVYRHYLLLHCVMMQAPDQSFSTVTSGPLGIHESQDGSVQKVCTAIMYHGLPN